MAMAYSYASQMRAKGKKVHWENYTPVVLRTSSGKLWRGQPWKTAGHIQRTVVRWENGKKEQWARAGRLMPDGTLRLDGLPAPRWTLQGIVRAFPHLGPKRAVVPYLILLDGVLTEADMATEKLINEVIDARIEAAGFVRAEDLDARVEDRLEEVLRAALTLTKTPSVEVKPASRRTRKQKIPHPKTGEPAKRKEVYAWLKANASDPVTMAYIREQMTPEEVAEVRFDQA